MYEGEWKGGMYHGSGTYTGFNSDSYAGEWKEDRMHGQGSYTYRDSGDVYEGSWIEGKREGYGKEICGNGDVCKQHGEPTHTFFHTLTAHTLISHTLTAHTVLAR